MKTEKSLRTVTCTNTKRKIKMSELLPKNAGERKRIPLASGVLFDKEPERYDVMYKFATGVFFSSSDLINVLKVVRKYKSTAPRINSGA